MSYEGYSAEIMKLYPITASLTEAGMPAPLGTMQRIPATSTGFTLGFVVTTTGVLAGGARFDMTSAYDSATHSSISLGAGEGEQLWLLVANNSGATIQRGMPVAWEADADSSDLYHVDAAAAALEAAQVLGVAQFAIPNGKAAYVLAKGVGKVVAGANVGSGARGDALKLNGSGLAIQSTAGDASIGVSLDDATTASALMDVRLG